jgi:enoyl-CoA hydratase/carnithine racemase
VPEPFTQISYEVADAIAWVTLDRPERLNAFTWVMATELIEAMDRADADDDVRVVILTGRGRAFCAGADLARGEDTFNDDGSDPTRGASTRGTIGGVPRDGGGTVSLRIARMLKPVIAAVNGPAVGVGSTMTLPADIRIASENAKFGFVFSRRGLAPEAASSWFLPRVVGVSQAMEWVATGRVFGAGEALEGRLVSGVYPAEELIGAATALAREIADNTSAVSVAVARQMIWRMLGEASPWDAHRFDSRCIHELGAAADVREGVSSFLEKRPAKFSMRVSTDLPDISPRWPEQPDDLVLDADGS